jgi:hypothetical protein
MEPQETRSGRNVVNGALRGAFRSVRLGWTDEVSGERLLVETSGDSSFFSALEAVGFERLPEGVSTPMSRRPAHVSARALTTRTPNVQRGLRGSAAG